MVTQPDIMDTWQHMRGHQGVFLAVGVWAFPTGNMKGWQEIMDSFGWDI